MSDERFGAPPREEDAYRTPPREEDAYRTPPREEDTYRTPPREEEAYRTPPREEEAYRTPPREPVYRTPPREEDAYRTPPREQVYRTPPRDVSVASLTRRVAQAIVDSEPAAKRARGAKGGDAGVRVLEIRQRREGPPRAARLFSLEGTHLRFMAEVDANAPLDLRVAGATLLPAPSSEEFLGAVQKAYAGCNDAGWHLNVCDGRDVTMAPHYLRGLASALYIAFDEAAEEGMLATPAIGGLIYVHRTRTPNTEEVNWVCKPSPPFEAGLARSDCPSLSEESRRLSDGPTSSALLGQSGGRTSSIAAPPLGARRRPTGSASFQEPTAGLAVSAEGARPAVRMHAFLRSVLGLRLEENAELQQFRLDVVGSERARPLYERVGFVPMPGGDEDEMVVRRETLLS